jgi:hypothetical protein
LSIRTKIADRNDGALAIAEQIDVGRYPGVPSGVSYRRRSGHAAARPAGLILTRSGPQYTSENKFFVPRFRLDQISATG